MQITLKQCLSQVQNRRGAGFAVSAMFFAASFSCSNLLSSDVGRFYLTLAQGQSGIDGNDDNLIPVDDDHLPDHKMDSWQAIYLSSYADLNLEKILPFDVERLLSLGYKCTGYK